MTIGEKIKHYRRLANMTQKELASDKMTRNMLSLIENGSAQPSLQTVKYLAFRLGVTEGMLVDDNLSVENIEGFELCERMKKLYKEKKYSACLEVYGESEGKISNDEICLILAHSCHKLGVEEYNDGTMKKATDMFSSALTYCEKTVYDTAGIKKSARLYLNLINYFFGRYAGDFIDFFDDSYNGYESINEILYAYCLQMLEGGDHTYAEEMSELPMFTNESYVMHINARCEMQKGNYSDAKKMLELLLENNENQHNASLLYSVYNDIEYCSTKDEDYKNAYKYAKLKDKLYRKLFLSDDDGVKAWKN